MSKFIQGITVQIGGDTSGLVKSLKSVTEEVTTVQSKIRTLNSALKLDPTNTELLNQKYELLNQSVQKTEERLKNLKDLQKQFVDSGGDTLSKEYIELERQIASCENSLKNAKKQQSEFNVAIEKAKVSFDNVSKSADNLAQKTQKASMIASGGILAMATASVKFEDAWAGVTKTVEGSDEQLAKIREGIFDLSKETASSAEDIAQVAENAGQLGIATDDVLEFTKVMVMLGDTTNLSADEASDSLARFANITKTSAEDYERLGSTIVALGNASASTESEIVEMSTRLASAGTLAGLSEQQILALATALSSVGIEAEAGGSAMSKLVKQIQVAVETGNKDLESFAKVANMSMTDFSELFEKDATKALLSFLEGLTDVERNGKSAIAILEDMGITEVRLSNAVLSMASNTDVLSDAIDTANTAWDENTAMQKEAEKRYGTTQSKLIQAKNAIVEAGVALGDTLLPMVKDVANAVADFAKWLADLDPKLQQVIVGATGLVAVASPLFKMISNISGGLSALTPLLGKVANFFSIAKPSMDGVLSTGMQMPSMLSGWGGAIGAFLAIGGGFILWAKSLGDEQKALVNSINEEIAAFEELKNAQSTALAENTAELDYLNSLKTELDEITDANGRVKKGYEDRADYIINELQTATGIEISNINGVIDGYDELSDSIDNYLLKQQAQKVVQEQQALADEAETKRKEAVNELVKLQMQLDDAQTKQEQLNTELRKKYGDDWLDHYLTNSELLHDQMYIDWSFASADVQNYQNAVNLKEQYCDELTETINQASTNQLRIQSDSTEEYKKILADSVLYEAETQAEKQEIIQTYLAQAQKDLAYYEEMYKQTNDDVYLDQIENSKDMVQTYQGMLDDISQSVKDSKTTIYEDFATLSEEGKKGIASVNYYSVGNSMGVNFSSGFKNGADGLKSYANSLAGTIVSNIRNKLGIHSPSKEAEEIGYYFDKGLAIGLDSGQVTKQIEQMNKQLKSSIDFGQIDTSFSSVPIYIQNTLTLDGKVVTQSVVKHITKNQSLRTQFKGG